MRIARNLMVAALAATAALALTAATATASHLGSGETHIGQTLTVTNEAGVTCPAASISGHAVSGGCEIHANVAEIQLEGHVFGIESIASACNIEFSGHAGGDGEGWIDQAAHTDPAEPHEPDSCKRAPCAEAEGMTPWPFHLDEEAGNAFLQFEFCRVNDDSGQMQRCLAALPINEVSPHNYQSGPFHTGGGTVPDATNHLNAPNCEVEVDNATGIAVEGTPIELVHGA